MPAQAASRIGAVAVTVFTSLVAPILVSLFTNAIKADGSRHARGDTVRVQTVTSEWPDFPPPGPATHLSPPMPPASAPAGPPGAPDSRGLS